MSVLVSINSVNVEFLNSGNEVFINSVDLCAVFKKEHKSILRNIGNLPNDEFKFTNFKKGNQLLYKFYKNI